MQPVSHQEMVIQTDSSPGCPNKTPLLAVLRLFHGLLAQLCLSHLRQGHPPGSQRRAGPGRRDLVGELQRRTARTQVAVARCGSTAGAQAHGKDEAPDGGQEEEVGHEEGENNDGHRLARSSLRRAGVSPSGEGRVTAIRAGQSEAAADRSEVASRSSQPPDQSGVLL